VGASPRGAGASDVQNVHLAVGDVEGGLVIGERACQPTRSGREGSGRQILGPDGSRRDGPDPPQSAVDPGVTVNGARGLGARLIFGLKTY
jgi:hypothetical protein